jgi:hypothetical protein
VKRTRRRATTMGAGAVALLAVPAPAYADNCSSLGDCGFGIKLALALLAIVLAIALWYALGPLIAQWLAQRAVANAILNAVRANTMRHIFGKAAHNLAPLVARFGSERAVVAAVARAMARLPAGSFPASGTFQVVVRVGGQNVTVRGAVVNGIIRIATMWV